MADLGALNAQILAHSRFFDSLVDMIPAKFYHAADSDSLLNLRTMKKAARAAAKQELKAAYKVNKRAKLDPDAPGTALEMQRAHVRPAVAADPTSVASTSAPAAVQLGSASLSREELRMRLQQKIQLTQQRRVVQDQAATAVKAKQWRDQTLADNAKHKQQQQQQLQQPGKPSAQQMAGSKRKAGDAEDAAAAQPTRQSGSTAGSKPGSQKDAAPHKKQAAPALQQQAQQQPPGQSKTHEAAGAASAAPTATGADVGALVDDDFQFAKLDFQGRQLLHKGGPKKAKLSKEQLLAAAEAKAQEKAAALASEDGKVELVRDAWRTAMARAGGDKVLDDPKLLRRSLKKDLKRKEKSQKQWQERHEQQVAGMEKRQQKRKDALQTRTTTKINNKRDKREKKLLRAGFEGRKAGFIGGKA